MRNQNRPVKLPILKTTPAKKEPLLPINTQVRLRSNSSGGTGCVTGQRRGKLLVRWPDMDFVGAHGVDGLIVIVAPETDAPRENPHDRILRKLREDNGCKTQTDNREGRS